MKYSKRIRFVVGVGAGLSVALVTGVFALRFASPARDIPAGTGYSALELCSRTMQIGQPFELVRDRYVAPKTRQLSDIWRVDHRPNEAVSVETRVPTLQHARTAVYREGLGCTIVAPGPGTMAEREAALRRQPFNAIASGPAMDAPWPVGEGSAETRTVPDSWRPLVARHEAIIFDRQPGNDAHTNTTALLIAHNGHLIHERYGEGLARHHPQLGWSMTKTLTALIAGVMAGDGKLSLDAHVGLSHWKGTDKARITWRHLLNMAPGIAWFEGYGGASDATEMLFGRADQGAYAADLPLTSEPGSVFTYSTGFSNIAMSRMRELTGGSLQSIYDYYQTRLFRPLGIRGATIEPDASGTPVGGARGMLRPVDWLRLGQLIARGGRWGDGQLIPNEFMAFLVAPSPASDGYGGSIWRRDAEHLLPRQRRQLPDDLVWMAGHMGQFTIIVPSRGLVVLRMGVAFTRQPAVQRAFDLVIDLLKAGDQAMSNTSSKRISPTDTSAPSVLR